MKYFYAILLAAVVLGVVTVVGFNSAIHQAGQNEKAVHLTIAKGSGVRQSADALVANHVMTSRWVWNTYIVLSGRRSSILAGDYDLPAHVSVYDAARIMTSSSSNSDEVTVKIREGLRTDEIADILDKAGVVSATDFETYVSTHATIPGEQYVFLSASSTTGLDGYLFPDTYRFFKHTTAAGVAAKMVANFDARLTSAMRTAFASQNRSYRQVVIMASILEAELKSSADRAKAADIFWRRLDAGMGLNADTTVLYALKARKELVTNEDLKVNSPYNTYTNKGLPPGPIDNPGSSSIMAALEPTANTYWYYLTAKDGSTVFATTYAEHLKNKAKYL